MERKLDKKRMMMMIMGYVSKKSLGAMREINQTTAMVKSGSYIH